MASVMLSLSFVLAGCAVLGVPVEEDRLEFVTFVHRHGDRSPVSTYPTDPHGNESLWNNGWGQLTNAGKRSAYELGSWFRERYATFLPEIYAAKDYEARSTTVDRALMSAYSVLAGLYKPTGTDVWKADVAWQPIPVRSTPEDMDNVLAASKPCPRHSQLLLKLLASEEISELVDSFATVSSEVARHAGFHSTHPLVNFIYSSSVYDTLLVQSLNGYRLPDWTHSYFPKPLDSLASVFLRFSTYNRPLQRLSCGLLVKDILNNFRSKSKGLLTKKMWQYSAHDITIVGLRQCLNLNETDSPPYSSSLILELRSKQKEYYVRILYKTENSLRTLVVPGCSENCPLQKFEELTKPIIPDDWDAECRPVAS